jgi:hypothetical protein
MIARGIAFVTVAILIIPMIATVLPFAIPSILCYGRNRPFFVLASAIYYPLLWLFATTIIGIDEIPATVFVIGGVVVFGRKRLPSSEKWWRKD